VAEKVIEKNPNLINLAFNYWRIHTTMDEKTFFKNLLEKTKEVFLTSQTYKEHGEKNWNYAVCDTPIQKNTGIFFGLNWGGSDINTQSVYPEFIEDRNWNFATHSMAYLREFLGKEIEQLNYCIRLE